MVALERGHNTVGRNRLPRQRVDQSCRLADVRDGFERQRRSSSARESGVPVRAGIACALASGDRVAGIEREHDRQPVA